MSRPRWFRGGIVLACAGLLAVPVVGEATSGSPSQYPSPDRQRVAYATDTDGNLLAFRVGSPQAIRFKKAITGLPQGVSLKGIDFRPVNGDLYGLGSDNVIYRVNTFTAIAKAEGPQVATAVPLRGSFFGVDFNPAADRVRVVSDANQNLRYVPDGGAQVAPPDADLNPGDPNVVAAAYTNSSFSATRPATTVLYTLDTNLDTINIQNLPNAGTQTMPKPVDVNLGRDTQFDIAGADDQGYIATTPVGRLGARLLTVDITTGKTQDLGRIGRVGSRITGLAVWQDG